MRTVTKIALSTIAPVILGGFTMAATAAPAFAVVNLGQCQKQSPYNQAPGHTGMGPLTIDANGVLHMPAAFAGAEGCSVSN